MADTNRKLVLAERPSGLVDERTIRLDEEPIPQPGEGEALVRVRYLSIDPTIRTWMDDVVGYLPPIGMGEVIRSGAVGEVVRSNSSRYSEGDLVFSLLGWQDYAILSDRSGEAQVLPAGVPPTLAINLFGITGMTAYFGLKDVGRVQAGDSVVVSAAAGATGSTVGQIANIEGAARVVGIAGSDEKCRWITEELGFAAAINYRTEPVGRRLHETCPDGIDLYFDNVGGDILDACLGHLAMHGRVVLCGAIASYNESERPPGPGNYRNLITRRGRMEGFIILDYASRYAQAQSDMARWLGEGRLHHTEHLVAGLEHAPDALNLLFTGGNRGKVVVEL